MHTSGKRLVSKIYKEPPRTMGSNLYALNTQVENGCPCALPLRFDIPLKIKVVKEFRDFHL